MKKIITAVFVAILLGHSARAMVIIATNTVSYVGYSGGAALPSDNLYVTYDVNENTPGVYEYDYSLNTVAPEDLTSFTIGGDADPLDTVTMAITDYGQASVGGSGFDNNSVGWDWGFNAGVTGDSLSFTSDIAPGYATFTAIDHDIEWSSPLSIPAPVPPVAPVPEPSSFALLAGAMGMLGFFVRGRKNS